MVTVTVRFWFVLFFVLTIVAPSCVANESELAVSGPSLSKSIREAEKAWKSGDFGTGLKLAMKARELAVAGHKVREEAEACRILGEIWFDRNENKSLAFYSEELRCREKIGDKLGQAYCYNASGILLKRKGLYFNALTDYYKSLRIAETISDSSDRLGRTSSAAFNIASIYDTFHFYHKSIHYYQISLDCEKRLSNREGESLTMANMSITYRKLKKFDKALSYAHKALEFAKKLGNNEETIRITNNLGYSYLKVGNIKKALELHKEALDMAQKDHVDDMLPYIYSGLGEIYFKLKKYTKALKYQLDALQLCKEDDFRVLIYRNLTDVCIALHDIPRSSEYFTRYKFLLDKYYSPESFAKTETLMNAFEQEQKDKEIQLLKKDKKIQDLLKNGFILGFFTVLMFLLWMISRYRMKQRMNRRLDNLSRHDPLTGLSNRRDVMERLRLEHARSIRNKNPLSICICDIDFFKAVNDTHGHSAGDTVLSRLALILKDSLRETDISGRWGGEEFILVFPETDLSGARETIEKLRKQIYGTPIQFEGKSIKITVTFGISQCMSEEAVETCINRADEALYKGKASGRNCVVSAG
ncbi:MAG: GGDEF domain-containing protein [Acidobacteria bacterium]|nr:GGDEF domain-containing protein [Acidobacteriota bacterium]